MGSWVAAVDSQGMERISQHGFPCGLRHLPPRQLEAAVLHRPLAGPVDQVLEGGLCPGPLSQLPELRVGPVPQPLSLGGPRSRAEEWAWVGVMESWGLVAVAGLEDSS